MGFVADSLVIVNLTNCTSVESRRSEKDLNDAAARVNKAAANIAARKFDPITGRHCHFCSYRNICPAQEDLMLVQPVARAANVN